ncbi:MAG: DNA repair exonuclease [Desulfovibrio sp.]|nr:DNA repair exonuclease [Desulfovibrio sp.]
MMKAIRYIHASDLHLDAPFLGISQRLPNGQRLTQKLHDATFTALSRLESLCLEQHADFLVLTGDLTNSEEQSIRARLALHAFCQKLAKAKIAVYIICGNHDPLKTSRHTIPLPENVTVFNDSVEQALWLRDNEVSAVIHGLSLTNRCEKRNVSQLFSRDLAHKDCFQLGLLHATVHGSDKSECCAPCSLEDLQRTGLDAWALGHVHKAAVLADTPCITYAGSPQGLAINESGNHGCYVINAENHEGQWRCQTTFHALAPIVWQTVRVDIQGLGEMPLLVNHVVSALEKARTELSPQARCLFVHLVLSGTTELDRELASHSDELLHELAYLQNESPELWIHHLSLETNGPHSLEAYRERDDLLGACLREAQHLAENSSLQEAFFAEALQPLLHASPLTKLLPPLDDKLRLTLLNDAQKICLARMEDGRVH